MDLGEIFKRDFKVMPATGGGFVVWYGTATPMIERCFAFTNIADLMQWLTKNADALAGQQHACDEDDQ